MDVSVSMNYTFPSGDGRYSIAKITGLKEAMASVSDAMRTATETTKGSLMVSLVPYTSAVSVAQVRTQLYSRSLPYGPAGRTPAKERYVRMLAGAPAPGETMADTLRKARGAVADGWGHWVDSFHHYGVGKDLGPLRKQSLPKELLDDTDWDLSKDMALDVSGQVPRLGSWNVYGDDFWNGCLMARWGAYWEPDARPAGWTANRTANWPARKRVAGWSARSGELPASTPLHLSDAPPDANDAHSLFTAYSWPDARISGWADHRLQTVMATLLEAPETPTVGDEDSPQSLDTYLTLADNDWSRSISANAVRGLCPRQSITPLTHDWEQISQAVGYVQYGVQVSDLQFAKPGTAGSAATFHHLGVVWALRTLSPLWQRVWQVNDVGGAVRPGVPCARNESGVGCNSRLKKTILIIADGINYPGNVINSRIRKAHQYQESRVELGYRLRPQSAVHTQIPGGCGNGQRYRFRQAVQRLSRRGQIRGGRRRKGVGRVRGARRLDGHPGAARLAQGGSGKLDTLATVPGS